ncbi:G-patch domain-containing protein [Botrytis cinerea]
MDNTSDEDTYEIPLQDQRAFGAGIKRKRVKFVPSTSSSTIEPTPSTSSAKSISDFYLKLVLPQDTSTPESTSRENSLPLRDSEVCEVCKLPLSTDLESIINNDEAGSSGPSNPTSSAKPRLHEASLAHQGLTYLSSYGWDPDSRLGLGASGQGIQFPIKTKPKDDKLGIGVVMPKKGEIRKKEKPQKLDAGKVRNLHEKDRRKGEKLREMFYRNDDVERYLRGG